MNSRPTLCSIIAPGLQGIAEGCPWQACDFVGIVRLEFKQLILISN
jgi:hypothetical protein